MASPRRVGSERSKTRDRLLDGVERLMLDEGYAAVTYRAVATQSGVTAGLVQYYFPSLDDLFVASIRRYTDRNVEHLVQALERRADEPMRLLWEYGRDESSAALMMEYMALGNHRKSIRSELADVILRVQAIELEALAKRSSARGDATGDDLPPAAQLFLLTGLPKLIQLFEAFGVSTGHREIEAHVEAYLDDVEPRERARPRDAATRPRGLLP